jgi:hypothetical protein
MLLFWRASSNPPRAWHRLREPDTPFLVEPTETRYLEQLNFRKILVSPNEPSNLEDTEEELHGEPGDLSPPTTHQSKAASD